MKLLWGIAFSLLVVFLNWIRKFYLSAKHNLYTEHNKPRHHQPQEKANKHRHEHDKDNKWNSQSDIAAKINNKK